MSPRYSKAVVPIVGPSAAMVTSPHEPNILKRDAIQRNNLSYSKKNISISVSDFIFRKQDRRYMSEILPIRLKTISNQSTNQIAREKTDSRQRFYVDCSTSFKSWACCKYVHVLKVVEIRHIGPIAYLLDIINILQINLRNCTWYLSISVIKQKIKNVHF